MYFTQSTTFISSSHHLIISSSPPNPNPIQSMDELDCASLADQTLSAPSASLSYDGEGSTTRIPPPSSTLPISNESMNLPHSTAMHNNNKLKEANSKYKQLLKLAKERIQAQEDELDLLRASASSVGTCNY